MSQVKSSRNHLRTIYLCTSLITYKVYGKHSFKVGVPILKITVTTPNWSSHDEVHLFPGSSYPVTFDVDDLSCGSNGLFVTILRLSFFSFCVYVTPLLHFPKPEVSLYSLRVTFFLLKFGKSSNWDLRGSLEPRVDSPPVFKFLLSYR